MSVIGKRIATRRAAMGWSQSELARRAGVKQQTIHQIEGGTIQTTRALADIAKALEVSRDWLETGANPPDPPQPRHVQLVGYVGAGLQVFPFDDHAKGGGFEEDLLAPPGLEDAVAVEIRGDSGYPVYRPGDRVYYRRDRDGVPTMAIGQECVVKVLDGPTLLKTVRRGRARALFDLESYNAPPLPDQKLEWASPVLWHDKSGRLRGTL